MVTGTMLGGHVTMGDGSVIGVIASRICHGGSGCLIVPNYRTEISDETFQGGMSLSSGVVTPIQHLSIDDVRDFFEHRLRQIGNDRLKLGNVTETDADGITVEIVTVEDSLVDRLAVDRHSGVIQRVQ